MKRLDLCSGTAAPQRKREGYVTTDIRLFDGIDHAIRLETDVKLPFDDNEFDFIRAHDALEHIRDGLFDVMDECWRVLKPKGVFDITVPRFPMPSAILHPEHFQFFLSAEDAKPFAEALAPLLLGKVQKLFCVHTWAFFMTPSEGVDPHGYLKGFWHIIEQKADGSHIQVKLTPNKPDGRFPYTEVTRRDHK